MANVIKTRITTNKGWTQRVCKCYQIKKQIELSCNHLSIN